MIRTTIIDKARKNANDTDTTDPFHTTAECHGILDDWALEVAGKVKLPKTTQSISFAQGEGGVVSSAKTLNTNVFAITSVVMHRGAASNLEHRNLKPSTLEEMNDRDAAWQARSAEAAPTWYIIPDRITAAGAAFSGRTITVDRRVDAAYTMIVEYIIMPAASTDGTLSPEFHPALHKSAEYYLTWHMLEPRDENRAERFRKLYERAMREAITASPFIQDDVRSQIWGDVPDFSN